MRFYLHKVFTSGWISLTTLLFSATLAGCGGGDPVEGGLPGVRGNPPATIRISYPVSDAILDLKGGYYRRYGSVIVTDREGNAVADGTLIRLIVVDSIKAYGTIDPGDSINGTTITDIAPLLGDFTTPTTLDTAYVDRAASIHEINETDHVFLFNSYSLDRARQVGATSASNPTNTTLSTEVPYTTVYPDALYDGITFRTEYIVGASLLGSSIAGSGGTIGYATTTDGRASFYVSYPADVNHIRTGCPMPATAIDDRHLPADSSHTFVAAVVDEYEEVNVIDNGLAGVFPNRYPEKTGFCFSTIRGGTISITLSTVGATNYVSGRCEDGGDGVSVPFATVTLGSTDPGVLSVTSPAITDRFGNYFTTWTTVAPGSADIVVECNGGATNSVSITVT